MKIVLTGNFPIAKSALVRQLAQQGHTIASRVSRDVDVVFVGRFPGSAYAKALALGVPCADGLGNPLLKPLFTE